MRIVLLILLIVSGYAHADGRQVDDYQWEGVQRVVAVGDIHGDYDNYLATLKAAGLVDKKGKWAGGETHFVQVGDIPDRGPDTRKIIEHMVKLQKQARRKGGQVHALLGNHEAMNVTGDLRYVHEGEFEAFKNRDSKALRDRAFEGTMKNMQANDPEGYAALPDNYREEWNQQHPLGWIEHRQAWDPSWNPDGEFVKWSLDRKVAIRIDDTLFLHGGISGFYCQNSLDSITQFVREKLMNYDPLDPGVIEDEFGPLWYRGLSGVEPRAAEETVAAILEHHGVKRIVVGHTVTSGIIWPEYDSRVVVIDTGISEAYGGYVAYLEIGADGLTAGYPAGRLALPAEDSGRLAYLERVMAMDPSNGYLKQRLAGLQQTDSAAELDSSATVDTDAAQAVKKPVPICGISQ